MIRLGVKLQLLAFLLITLAGSFFVDLANAFVAKGILALPFFNITPALGGG